MAAPNRLSVASVKKRVGAATRKLLVSHGQLLRNDLAELTIAHRFAVLLSDQFPGRDVDVNYNRHGTEIKRLHLPRPCARQIGRARRVFPDIVVHRQGTDASNLLVIEIKKSTNTESRECDIEKLLAFREQLRYDFGLFLEFEAGTAAPSVLSMVWFE